MLKNTLFTFLIASLALSLIPYNLAQAQETDVPERDHVRLAMSVRWGNVLEEPIAIGQQDFDGSISVSDGHVATIRPLKFEHHDDAKDRLTSRANPISWTSWTYGHWDGVKAGVSAPADAVVNIETAQGGLSMSAQELASLTEPLIHDLGNGREIVVQTKRYRARNFGLRVYWGDPHKRENPDATLRQRLKARNLTDRADASDKNTDAVTIQAEGDELSDRLVNFSGSLSTGNGATLDFKKELRFEEKQGDAIVSTSDTSVVWNSFIAGGVDGVLVRPHLEKDAARDDTLTVNFSELEWSQEFSLPKLFINRITRERIQVGDKTYVLVLEVKRRPHGSLLRDGRDGRVYRLEDDELKPVLSPAAFSANELDWAEVENATPEEIDELPIGEPLEMPDGVLVRAASHPTVFVASEGCMRPFLNERAFHRLSFSFDDVIWLPDGDVAAFPVCQQLDEDSPHPNGALLRAKGTAGVYQILGGRKVPVRSREVFETHRLSFDNVLEVGADTLAGYVESVELEPAEGSLIQAEGSDKVYEIIGGQKRLVVDPEDLTARRRMANKLRKIIKVKSHQVDTLDIGEVVAGLD